MAHGSWTDQLSGQLSQATDVTQLIGHIVTGQHDASLCLGDPAQDGLLLSFVGGELLRVHSCAQVHRLLDHLQQEGRLSLAQLDDTSARSFVDAESAIAHLVDAGLLRAQAARPLLIAHQESLLTQALQRTAGAFALQLGHKTSDLSAPWLPKERLVLDGIRAHYKAQRLRALLGPADAALSLCGVVPDSLELKEPERRWVQRLDGRLSIAAAAEHAELPLLWAQQLALGLLRLRRAQFTTDLRQANFAVAPADNLDGAAHAEGGVDGSAWAPDAQLLDDKLTQARKRDYFTLLGLCPTALPSEVYAAATHLLLLCDAPRWPEAQRKAVDELRHIVDDARDVLLDSRRAAEYAAHIL